MILAADSRLLQVVKPRASDNMISEFLSGSLEGRFLASSYPFRPPPTGAALTCIPEGPTRPSRSNDAGEPMIGLALAAMPSIAGRRRSHPLLDQFEHQQIGPLQRIVIVVGEDVDQRFAAGSPAPAGVVSGVM